MGTGRAFLARKGGKTRLKKGKNTACLRHFRLSWGPGGKMKGGEFRGLGGGAQKAFLREDHRQRRLGTSNGEGFLLTGWGGAEGGGGIGPVQIGDGGR